MSISQKIISKHYKTAGIMKTILRVSTDGECNRAGMKFTPKAYKDKNGEIKDSIDWYNGMFSSRKHDYKLNLSIEKDYIKAIEECRTLYWTLNVFESDIFDIDYRGVEKSERTMLSRAYTAGYTFGIDIDREHGTDIHNPDVKKAVEDMGQFFADKLREYAPNSVYCLYSGGGIYVMLHHKVFEPYFEKFRNTDEWDVMFMTLLDAFDYLIGDIRDEFFKLHPEHTGKVKPDQLNNSQRVFKTIFSVHKSLDYAVIPLDPKGVYIDFERAALPLSNDVISSGDSWYDNYDDGRDFLNNILKPYLNMAHERKQKHTFSSCNSGSGVEVSAVPIEDIEKWPPCMRNIYNLHTCGEGKTRALAIFVSFLGQIGIAEEYARFLFDEVSDRWGATKSNIFESYFRNMKVPTCARLGSTDNRGFPKGVSIKSLNVCRPNARCVNVPSPRYYADTEANQKRLRSPVTEKPIELKEKAGKCQPVKNNFGEYQANIKSAPRGSSIKTRLPRTKSFEATVSDIKLVNDDYGGTNLFLEFGSESPLSIKMNLDKWTLTPVGGTAPKPGSAIYKFLRSVIEQDIKMDISDDMTSISAPSMLGKLCKFDLKSESFTQNGEDVKYKVWTLAGVSEAVKATI